MSKIEWTESTWNPVVGCTKVSPGCDNCYAERMANRVRGMMYFQSTDKSMATWEKYDEVLTMDGKWNGHVFCDESALEIPLHWRKPRMIFSDSMGDMFHKSVPFEFIDKVMGIIVNCPQHTFQILTKRAKRMWEYFDGLFQDYRHSSGVFDLDAAGKITDILPLLNLWLGVTAENQEQADKRIPILLQIPAAVRFVSIEPMLGAVDLSLFGTVPKSWGVGYCHIADLLDWVIVGGESGPGARYCPVDNIRDVVKQCKAAGVPVFVKQMHLWKVRINKILGQKEPKENIYFETIKDAKDWWSECKPKRVLIKDINQFPEDLRIRQYPKGGK
ncbi:hypothetical protein LCGC14_0403640 [marine sediment metagenome]|uniref:Phage Gp37Gp68 family protein n=1 Tax=marine sediment metagenome TaxID=412755 RepID=A0A0F9VI43_9ZZZZ